MTRSSPTSMRGSKQLIAKLKERGVLFALAGSKLLADGPPGVITDSVEAKLRELAEKIAEHPQRAIDAGIVENAEELAQIQKQWQVALDQARTDFRSRGLTPDLPTLQAAAWLEVLHRRGWPRWVPGGSVDWEELFTRRARIYSGARGRLLPSGEPVLADAPQRPRWRSRSEVSPPSEEEATA